jgi:hypothetical protein
VSEFVSKFRWFFGCHTVAIFSQATAPDLTLLIGAMRPCQPSYPPPAHLILRSIAAQRASQGRDLLAVAAEMVEVASAMSDDVDVALAAASALELEAAETEPEEPWDPEADAADMAEILEAFDADTDHGDHGHGDHDGGSSGSSSGPAAKRQRQSQVS